MRGCKRLISFTVASLAGITFAISASKALAQQALQPGQTVSGIISEGTSRLFVSKGNQYLGEEYTFEGRAGDKIMVAVVKEIGSSLNPIVDLIGPSGLVERIGSSERELNLTGTWKVRVLSFKKTQGRYQVSLVKRVDQGQALIDLLRVQRETEEKRRQEEEAKRQAEENLIPAGWGLISVACGGSGVVEISINAKLACAVPRADLPAGRYAYDRARDELVPLSVPSALNVNPPNQEGGIRF